VHNGVGPKRARGALVVVECMLAVVLLAGAGLVLRSLHRIRTIDPGFDPSHVLLVRIEFPPDALIDLSGLPKDEIAMGMRRAQLASNLLPAVRSLPGVRDAGFIDDMFVVGHPSGSITIPGRNEVETAPGELNSVAASDGFFRTLRVPLRQGRYLANDDVRAKVSALYGPLAMTGSLAEREAQARFEPVVVNEAFVHRYFPNEAPIGKHFCIDPTNKTYWYMIVGVVGDMRRQGQAKATIPEFYGAYVPMPNSRFDLVVRTQAEPMALSGNIRSAIERTLPDALIPSISTAENQLGDFNAQRDFQARLLTVFAALALLLAATGIYGVVHYAVAERTREVGVRVALGATPAAVMGMVVRQGMSTPLLGVGVGIVVAMGATRVLSGMLYGIGPMDPITFGGVAITLIGVALVACVFPAHRASRVDPVSALRRE
jgi:putative ABC transport system permease protein